MLHSSLRSVKLRQPRLDHAAVLSFPGSPPFRPSSLQPEKAGYCWVLLLGESEQASGTLDGNGGIPPAKILKKSYKFTK